MKVTYDRKPIARRKRLTTDVDRIRVGDLYTESMFLPGNVFVVTRIKPSSRTACSRETKMLALFSDAFWDVGDELEVSFTSEKESRVDLWLHRQADLDPR